MSDNYNPQITQVRPSFDTRAIGPVWRKTDSGDASALLVEGVPMVGERVEDSMGKTGVVEHYVVWAQLRSENEWRRLGLHRVDGLRPATQNAEVEAVAEALAEFHRDELNPGAYLNQARAAIEALDRVRGGDD